MSTDHPPRVLPVGADQTGGQVAARTCSAGPGQPNADPTHGAADASDGSQSPICSVAGVPPRGTPRNHDDEIQNALWEMNARMERDTLRRIQFEMECD